MDLSNVYICYKWDIKVKASYRKKGAKKTTLKTLNIPCLGHNEHQAEVALKVSLSKRKLTLIEVEEKKWLGISWAFYKDTLAYLNNQELKELYEATVNLFAPVPLTQ